VRQQEIYQKRLAAPGSSQNQRMGDVGAMQVQEVRRRMVRLQQREILTVQVGL
jgi:hypothetical protein